jgi:5,10-methenyltetrahydromethanopterin hydrogenase
MKAIRVVIQNQLCHKFGKVKEIESQKIPQTTERSNSFTHPKDLGFKITTDDKEAIKNAD